MANIVWSYVEMFWYILQTHALMKQPFILEENGEHKANYSFVFISWMCYFERDVFLYVFFPLIVFVHVII